MLDISISLIVPMIMGFLAGQYLDKRFGGAFPTWTIIFSIVGIITGFWSVYKRYIK